MMKTWQVQKANKSLTASGSPQIGYKDFLDESKLHLNDLKCSAEQGESATYSNKIIKRKQI